MSGKNDRQDYYITVRYKQGMELFVVATGSRRRKSEGKIGNGEIRVG